MLSGRPDCGVAIKRCQTVANTSYACCRMTATIAALRPHVRTKLDTRTTRDACRYKASAYFLAKMTAETMTYIVTPILFSCIAYWMVGLQVRHGLRKGERVCMANPGQTPHLLRRESVCMRVCLSGAAAVHCSSGPGIGHVEAPIWPGAGPL